MKSKIVPSSAIEAHPTMSLRARDYIDAEPVKPAKKKPSSRRVVKTKPLMSVSAVRRAIARRCWDDNGNRIPGRAHRHVERSTAEKVLASKPADMAKLDAAIYEAAGWTEVAS